MHKGGLSDLPWNDPNSDLMGDFAAAIQQQAKDEWREVQRRRRYNDEDSLQSLTVRRPSDEW